MAEQHFDIVKNEKCTFFDVRLKPTTPTSTLQAANASLSLLSVIYTANVPLHLILNERYEVSTTDRGTAAWLDVILTPDRSDLEWQQRSDSTNGILCAIQHIGKSRPPSPKPTELLIYATWGNDSCSYSTAPTPAAPIAAWSNLRLWAICLSSELLYAGNGGTSLLTPSTENSGVFLPRTFAPSDDNVIHEPPVKRTRTAASTLDEAVERRKTSRRSTSIATESNASVHPVAHRRSLSGRAVPLQNRPLSRSPSISSNRPGSSKELVTDPSRRSTLSKVQTLASGDQTSSEITSEDTEQKNKDLISRLVMAGMRLYGYEQTKSRRESHINSPRLVPSVPQDDAEKEAHEAYKLLYHQLYRSTCFTFRTRILDTPLQPYMQVVSETVDAFLNMFTSDPLANGLRSDAVNDLTPGGRKPFGSAVSPAIQRNEPFKIQR